VFSLKERDDREQKVQQFLDQLRVALIEFPLFDAFDETLDLGRVSGWNVIVVFHWRQIAPNLQRLALACSGGQPQAATLSIHFAINCTMMAFYEICDS
jgi:hypothetical protein